MNELWLNRPRESGATKLSTQLRMGNAVNLAYCVPNFPTPAYDGRCVFKLLTSHWSILFSKMSFHMSPQITCPIRCIVT